MYSFREKLLRYKEDLCCRDLVVLNAISHSLFIVPAHFPSFQKHLTNITFCRMPSRFPPTSVAVQAPELSEAGTITTHKIQLRFRKRHRMLVSNLNEPRIVYSLSLSLSFRMSGSTQKPYLPCENNCEFSVMRFGWEHLFAGTIYTYMRAIQHI